MIRIPRVPPRPDDRGQTSFDFAVGMGVFLITLAFVLAFLPGTLEPFTATAGENMVVAERAAASLTEELLVTSVMAPNVLNQTCTAEFFDGDGLTAGCPFSADADDVPAAFGIDDTFRFNITIERAGSIRSVDGVTLSTGRAPPSGSDAVVAKRMVLLDGSEATVYVRVW